MASIHLARLLGPVGFGRTVAIKRLHAHFAKEPAFVAMFVDEARIVTSIRHPHVVPVLDVVALPGQLFLVMEYVHGESLHRLAALAHAKQTPIPPSIVSAVGINFLEGLHAAHSARGVGGAPLGIVHRDVSPQNVLVGSDGLARVLDFGIAKATSQLHETSAGSSHKGKLRYMSPEQINGQVVDRRADVWAAGVVLWELLTQRRLFAGDSNGAIVRNVLDMPIPPPSEVSPELGSFDTVIARALARAEVERYRDARSMALGLEAACKPASSREVSEWVESLVGPALREREVLLHDLEAMANAGMPSVRTQLAVIADQASRSETTGEEPAVRVSSDDATAPVGGRSPQRTVIPPKSAEIPALAVPGPAEATAPRPRARRVVANVAVVLFVAVFAAGTLLALVVRSRRSSPTTTASSAAVSAAVAATSAVIAVPPPPEVPAATPNAPPSAAPSGGKSPAGSRKPVRSDRGPDPDGVRLDKRK
jgi:serine/threonine-protein kinase